MKICAVICEYNPLHNGHIYQLGEMRRLSGCDAILCLMSGNFTQRGEAAIFDKYLRAERAVECGADLVLELPAAFSVAPAELFARGAVHILASIPAVTTLAFGCESGTAESFLGAAKTTLSEDKAFKTALKENMKDGTSYVKARTDAILRLYPEIDESLLTAPNNMLGVEYCRSILDMGASFSPLPILRRGAGYADTDLHTQFSSASALRAVMRDPSLSERRALKRNLPRNVYGDVSSLRKLPFEEAALCALFLADSDRIAETPDCAEGLENRICTVARTNPTYSELLQKTATKRYTAARIRRVIAQNFLGVRLKDVKEFLDSPLYCRVLAVKKSGAEQLLSTLAEGKFPALIRRGDLGLIKKQARACFDLDLRANALYSMLSGTVCGDFDTRFV